MKTIKIVQTTVIALAYLCLGITFVLLIGGNTSLVVRGIFVIIGVGLMIVNEVLIMVKELKFKKEKKKGNASK